MLSAVGLGPTWPVGFGLPGIGMSTSVVDALRGVGQLAHQALFQVFGIVFDSHEVGSFRVSLRTVYP